MRCYRHPDREVAVVCPDCGSPVCSECSTSQGFCQQCGAERALPRLAPARPQASPRSFRDLSTLAKCLTLYVLAVSIVAGLPIHMTSFGGVAQTLLGWLGIAAGILMILAKQTGWLLGLFWAAAQVLEIIVHHVPLNHQCIYIGGNFLTNGSGIGLNLVGAVLVVLFIVTRGQFTRE